MKSAKLIPEHQFILDCAWAMQEKDSGGLDELKGRYEIFYRDIETLGRNLAELVAEEGTQANIEGYIEMFEAGFSPDTLIEDPLSFEEGTFYCCGETVQEVNEIIIPDDADLPETDSEEILKAFRYGIKTGLQMFWHSKHIDELSDLRKKGAATL